MAGGVVGRAQDLLARAKATRPLRVWTRYGEAGGNVLAGGIAYFALFSVFPALAVGFTALGLVLNDQDELRQSVFDSLADTLPAGVVGDGGIVEGPDELVSSGSLLTIGGLIGFLGLLLTGLGWLGAVRQGIRSVFDVPLALGNALTSKLRDVGTLASLGLALLLSVVASLTVNAAAGALLSLVGIEASTGGTVALRVLGFAVVLAADTLIFVLLLRLLSGLRLPWAHVREAALIGAVGLGLLKLFGGLLLGRASENAYLATFGVVIGLLIWMNLLGRIILLSAAWAATAASAAAQAPVATAVPEGGSAPAAPILTGPRDVLLPSFGQRARDRTTIAAGAVLGILGMLGAGAVRRGVGTMVQAVRER